MGAEKEVVSACGSCVAGVVLVEGVGIERCDECKKYETDEAAASAVWSLWEQTNLFLALGDALLREIVEDAGEVVTSEMRERRK